MGNGNRMTNEVLAITSETIKEDKTHRNPTKWKDPKKNNEEKSDNIARRNESESMGEKCLARVKQYKHNWSFQNNERKFDQEVGGDGTRTNQQSDAKETKTILEWNMETEKILRKCWMDK